MFNEKSFTKPKLPAPIIPDRFQKLTAPHFSTPAGMLLPREQQPPPMFGLRGSTIPPKFLNPMPSYAQLKQDHPYKTSISKNIHNTKPLPSPLVYCDICDRSYKNNEKLDKHRIQEHKEILGIQKRVYTEDEINEWREARKKRYPTVQNVIARQAAQEERMKRGERLEESKSRFGRKKDRRPIRNQPHYDNISNRKQYNQRRKNNNSKPIIKPHFTEQDEDDQTLNGLKKFMGTSKLEGYEHTVILKHTKALSCIGAYGSDSNSSDFEDEEHDNKVDTEETLNESVQTLPQQDHESESDNSCEPMEVPIIKCDPFVSVGIESIADSNSNKRIRKRKHFNKNTEITNTSLEPEPSVPEKIVKKPDRESVNDNQLVSSSKQTVRPSWQHRYKRYQNTMLEKLLEPDVRHERNLLLQCVRFVVDNNFFGIDNSNLTVNKTGNINSKDNIRK